MKKHLFLVARILVALAGLGYIALKIDWTDKVEVPKGDYALSDPQGHPLGRNWHIDKPVAFPIESGSRADLNPVKPTGTIRILIDPQSTPPGYLTIDAEKELGHQAVAEARGEVRGEIRGFRLKAGLLSTLAHARLGLLLLAVLVTAPIYPVTAFRWWLLLRARGMAVPMWKAFRLSMVGCFFNYCMPGSTGGDLVKAYYAAKGTDRRADGVMTVIIDRVVGLLGLVILAGVAGLFIHGNPRAGKVTLIIWAVAAAILLGSAFYFSRHLRRISGFGWLLAKVFRPDSLPGKIDAAASAYSHHKGIVTLSIVLSLPVHILLALSASFTLYALMPADAPKPSLGLLMAVIPFLFLIAAVPISYQGLGFMEFFAVKLLAESQTAYPALATENQVVIMLMLIRLIQVTYSLLGSFFLLRGDIHMHPEKGDANAGGGGSDPLSLRERAGVRAS